MEHEHHKQDKKEECACGCCHEHHEHHDHDGCGCGCHDEHEHDGCGCGHDHGKEKEGSILRVVLTYVLGAIPVIMGFLPFLPPVVRIAAAAVAYLVFGLPVLRDMLRGFGRGQIFTEFTLMAVASLGAFAIGEYADGAAVVYLYALGEQISGSAYARSRRDLSELIAVTPEYACVMREGEAVRVEPEEVAVGERILIRAGERVPLDGTVVEGEGVADTSSVTGESLPLALWVGVSCPSGSILSEGAVYLRVDTPYEHSVVAELGRAVKEASRRKSAAEKKITRFARVFTPLAFGVAALIFFVGWLWTGEVSRWLRMALTVLVISCPCSLVLSVPLAYFAGLGAAARQGIVFRGGEIMDRVSHLSALALDKTGTLTESALSFDGATCEAGVSESEFLQLAYDVLLHSPHAAALSFCRAFVGEAKGTVTELEIVGGRGVVCRVEGVRTLFGNAALLREHGIDLPDSRTTAIFGAQDGRLLGTLHFFAHEKPEAAEAVAALRHVGVRSLSVLSGDGEDAVASVCKRVGIEEYEAALTPSEKLDSLEALMAREKSDDRRAVVGFCGDGLNDSAAIARADVGIAMGRCGSALTVSTADVVIMDDNLARLADAVRLSRRTERVAGACIALSLGIKSAVVLAGLALSVRGMGMPMELAIAADVGAAVLAVLLAMRASKIKQ